jgi:predicted permease
MTCLARLQSWLRSVVNRGRLETNMEEEIRFHLEARAADLVREGVPAGEAARRARLEFGGIASHKDDIRHRLGLRWWDELWSDLGYALRLLKKSPGFTIVAVGSLALAIGANTSIFSVANELLFERLPVPHPEQLRLLTVTGEDNVVIHEMWGNNHRVNGRQWYDVVSYPVYLQLKKQNQVMQPIFAFKDLGRANATVDGTAVQVRAEAVSGNFYDQMQVRPQLGRAILPSDDGAPGKSAVAMISDGFWKRAFGRSPDVIGKTIKVNTNPVTIVGVNPVSFTSAESVQVAPDLWVPMSMAPSIRTPMGMQESLLTSADLWWVQIMARTKPGISDEQARAALDTILRAAVQGTMTIAKGDTLPRMEVEDGSKGLHGSTDQYQEPIYVLLGMVGTVLVLACANMANLMLARAAAREREMSVRLALGASRWRVLRQVLTESLLLSCAGGALGLLMGYAGRTVLPNLVSNPWDGPPMHVPFNWKIFVFTAAITIGTGIAFGIFPAWAATRNEVGTALKQGSRTASRRRTAWSGKLIVAFQVALSTLLVVSAVLFLRTLVNLNAIDPGFRTDHLLLFEVSLPAKRYEPPNDVRLLTRLEDQLRHVPGVDGVTAATIPLLAGMSGNSGFTVEGVPPRTPAEEEADERHGINRTPWSDLVGNDFFTVMKIPILAGRGFNAQDTETSAKVSVINQSTARQIFAGQNPVGKRFSRGLPGDKDPGWVEIIGVCADTHYDDIRNDPRPLHIDLYRQGQTDGLTFIVSTQLKPEAIVPSLTAVVHRLDPDLPLMNVRTQKDQLQDGLQQERIFASLTSGFALLALSLALVGIYGVMSYTVAQRTNEIGIRLALGAPRQQVRGMVLREAGMLAGLGVASGLAVALAVGKLVGSLLYGLKPTDPVSLACAAGSLVVVALIAGWLPAARAAGVEPMVALRHD